MENKHQNQWIITKMTEITEERKTKEYKRNKRKNLWKN